MPRAVGAARGAATMGLLLSLVALAAGYLVPSIVPSAITGYASTAAFACFIVAQVAGLMSASGAFEVTLDPSAGGDGKGKAPEPVTLHSKLATGRYPTVDAVVAALARAT